MKLTDIEKLLTKTGFPVTVEPQDASFPVDRIIVELDYDVVNPKLYLQLFYVPGLDDKVKNARLLQFFITMPVDVNPAAIDEVYRMLTILNMKIPLVGFNLNPIDNTIIYRYIHIMGREDSKTVRGALMESISMLRYLVMTYQYMITDIALGRLPADSLLETT